MASTGKCPNCGGTLRSDEKNCPNCGAANEHYISDSPRTIYHPKTIEELKEYCAERGMPLLRMRFFIGEDYKEPRAFGIYRDGKDVIVYKNKADGSRAVRYRGPDEARGVNELFQKLLSECHNRGIYPDGRPVAQASPAVSALSSALGTRSGKKAPVWKVILLCLAFPFLVILGFVPLWIYLIDILVCAILRKLKPWPEECRRELASGTDGFWKKAGTALRYSFRYGPNSGLTGPAEKPYLCVCWVAPLIRASLAIALVVGMILSIKGLIHRNDGYYRAPDSTVYYQDGGSWYYYDPDGGSYDWYPADDFPADNYRDYELEEGWDQDWGGVSYSSGAVWEAPHSSSDSDSYSSSSDYDSWDSGGTDWDSDW